MSRGFKTFVLIVGPVALFSCIDPVPITLLAYVLGGWAPYLYRVIPQVRVSASGAVTLIVCLAAVFLIGHWMARWLSRESATRKWPARSTLALVMLVLLMFVAGIGATGVAHQTMWLARSKEPIFFDRYKEVVRRVKCQSNMRIIIEAIRDFAASHDGRLPDSIEELMTATDLDGTALICPATPDDWPTLQNRTTEQIVQTLRQPHHCSYIYHGRGLTLSTLSPGRVLLCEPLINHEAAGMSIGFADGSAQFESPTDAQRILSTMQR